MDNDNNLQVTELEIIMTIWQLILLAVAIGSFAIGRYSGWHDGYVAGRKAVRKYYEMQAGK